MSSTSRTWREELRPEFLPSELNPFRDQIFLVWQTLDNLLNQLLKIYFLHRIGANSELCRQFEEFADEVNYYKKAEFIHKFGIIDSKTMSGLHEINNYRKNFAHYSKLKKDKINKTDQDRILKLGFKLVEVLLKKALDLKPKEVKKSFEQWKKTVSIKK